MPSAPGSDATRCLSLLITLCLPLTAWGQTDPAAQSAAEATLKRPTDFRTRLELRNEYQELPGDGYRNLVIPRLEYAVARSVALRLETPYIISDPGPGAERARGFGDLLVRGAWRALQQDHFAMVLATDVIFDTALDDRLGQGKPCLLRTSMRPLTCQSTTRCSSRTCSTIFR